MLKPDCKSANLQSPPAIQQQPAIDKLNMFSM